MRKIYAILIGAGLGAGSVFLHSSLVPFGLIFVLFSTLLGIWCIGRMWGGRNLRQNQKLKELAHVLRSLKKVN